MSSLLYLPNWTVTEGGVVVDDDGAYNITATYDVHPEHCPACGSTSFYRHGSPRKEGKKFYDAPVHGRQTFIFVRRQRYVCRDCGKTWSQALPDMDEDRRMTHRCREYIQRQCLLKPNTHVAEDVGCNERTVREIGKVQAEKEAVKMAALRLSLMTCASCKAVFVPEPEQHHFTARRQGPKARAKALVALAAQTTTLCRWCHGFHTQTWFGHDGLSTRKSE